MGYKFFTIHCCSLAGDAAAASPQGDSATALTEFALFGCSCCMIFMAELLTVEDRN